jgi:hypothetical protein
VWIHLPSGVSPSAQESADLTLPSSWLFQELERSVTWNEKPRTSRSWFKGLKTAPWTMRLFGRISPPSTATRGVAEWISSMGVSHASPIATQGSGKGKQTSETYGRPPHESYERYVQGDFFSKTSLESPATTGTEFGLSYETWATRLRSWSSAQRAWAQATFGNGSLPWPTPDTTEAPNRQANTTRWGGNNSLSEFGKHWPTPDAYNDPIAGGSAPWQESYERGKQIHLHHSARMHWPTPRSSPNENRTTQRAPTHGVSHGKSLAAEANEAAMWPTPAAASGGTHTGISAETAQSELEKGSQIGLGAATAMWATPVVEDGGRSTQYAEKRGKTLYHKGKKVQQGLGDQAKMWATPRSSEITESPETGKNRMKRLAAEGKSTGGVENLSAQAIQANWATPNTRDHHAQGAGMNPGASAVGLPMQVSSLQAPATETPGHECSPKCRRLNPQFVGWLQGMPMGWTSLAPLNSEDWAIWWHLCKAHLQFLLSWEG